MSDDDVAESDSGAPVLPKIGAFPEGIEQSYARPRQLASLQNTPHNASTTSENGQQSVSDMPLANDYASRLTSGHQMPEKEHLPITRLQWSPALIASAIGILALVNLLLLVTLRPDMLPFKTGWGQDDSAFSVSSQEIAPPLPTPGVPSESHAITGIEAPEPAANEINGTKTNGKVDQIPRRRVLVITPEDRALLLQRLRREQTADQDGSESTENRLDTYVREDLAVTDSSDTEPLNGPPANAIQTQ